MAPPEAEHAAATDASAPRPADAPAGSADAANYRYWQQHGSEWADEYDNRKKWSVKYHAAELMLSEYVRNHAPLRVLEFGCGVGRHLKHLTQLPGVEIFGYDQSPTMVAECLRWAPRAWLDEHVIVGRPTGRLPYEDGSFDLVYSSEVLVHVRPADLEGILSELLRICRGHILHLEPAAETAICATAHDGCWNHDLVAAYAQLGRKCELLPAGYVEHTPYRVEVGAPPRYTWPPAMLALVRRMEADLKPMLLAGMEAPALRERLAQLAAELLAVQEQTRAAHHEYAVLFGKLEAVEREYRALRNAFDAGQRLLDERTAELERTRAALVEQTAAHDAARADLAQRCKSLTDDIDTLRAAAQDATRLRLERDDFLRRARELLDA